jgi:hypothetical protein
MLIGTRASNGAPQATATYFQLHRAFADASLNRLGNECH